MRKERSAPHKALKTTEEAARWFYELRSEECNDYEAYLEWLLESPQHVEAFLRVSAVDASLGNIDPERSIEIVPSIDGDSPKNVVPLLDDVAHSSSSDLKSAAIERLVPRHGFWALAASVALIGVLTVAIWWTTQNGSTQYVTAIGEQRAIALEDGSLLHMNTGSRVDVRYSANERSIRLLAGEALFRVQHEPTRPFRVHSGGAVIQAVGTQFNVLRRPDGSTVSVIEGRVRVDREEATLFLGAGEEIQLTNNGRVAARGKANIARVNGWQQRRLVFMNETLGAIVAEFGRYNRALDIEVEGSAAKLRGYEAMSFNADDPESLLAVLERDPNLEVERGPDKVIIRRR